MSRIFRMVSLDETDVSTINPLSLRDYSLSLKQSMERDKYGFWHSTGEEIKLYAFCIKKQIYIPDEKDPQCCISNGQSYDAHKIVASKHTDGLKTLVLEPLLPTTGKRPCVVICLGGPFINVPDVNAKDSIYHRFRQAGFYVVVPLRRGVIGINDGWDKFLRGNYGKFDVEDILQGTHDAIDATPQIDNNSVYLYGGSYGGYNALLIAGKHNENNLFKKIVTHCGIFNLAKYPYHCKAHHKDVMEEYAETTNEELFKERIAEITPHSYVASWHCPMLIVHTLDDDTCWFGQSVEAYNAGLNTNAPVKLLLAPGPHSYNIKNGENLTDYIIEFYN